MCQYCCPFCTCVFGDVFMGARLWELAVAKALRMHHATCVCLFYVKVGLTLTDSAKLIKSSPPTLV